VSGPPPPSLRVVKLQDAPLPQMHSKRERPEAAPAPRSTLRRGSGGHGVPTDVTESSASGSATSSPTIPSPRSSANSNSSTGTSTSETTVTLGKNIARNFYVAYERSLTSALGSFYIFYELSRQFTLRAQTGEQSTLDLIFTLRYD